jgi:hypothetical protein
MRRISLLVAISVDRDISIRIYSIVLYSSRLCGIIKSPCSVVGPNMRKETPADDTSDMSGVPKEKVKGGQAFTNPFFALARPFTPPHIIEKVEMPH